MQSSNGTTTKWSRCAACWFRPVLSSLTNFLQLEECRLLGAQHSRGQDALRAASGPFCFHSLISCIPLRCAACWLRPISCSLTNFLHPKRCRLSGVPYPKGQDALHACSGPFLSQLLSFCIGKDPDFQLYLTQGFKMRCVLAQPHLVLTH